ncbi:hypothetical protein HMPREF3032_00116 [Veillonella sp. DNF00869]|nr:hypothetical protein HMPREF3032_00116 [Veillonella sp. DNF00869]
MYKYNTKKTSHRQHLISIKFLGITENLTSIRLSPINGKSKYKW